MIHISSEDVSSGSSFNGVFTLSNTLSGNLTLKDSFVEAGEIPWLYTGCDVLRFTRVSDGMFFQINLPQTSDDATASVELLIETQFDGTGAFAGATVCTFVAATKTYDVVVTDAITLIWPDSSARFVFKKEKSANESNVTAFSLGANFVDNRPKYIEYHISETSSIGTSTHGSSADLFVSTFDDPVRNVTITLSSSHVTLDIEVRRVNVQQIPCPMTLKWDLMFG